MGRSENSIGVDKKLDEILNNLYLEKINLVEVRKQVLMLFGTMLSDGTLCTCNERRAFPIIEKSLWYCTNCGKEIIN